jgi:hypothetical protein
MKEVYEKPRPKGLGKPKALICLTRNVRLRLLQRSQGTDYPSLLANMAGARAKK